MLDHAVRGLFDHAGMFPPAALSFEDALREAAVLPDVLARPDLLQNDLVLTPEHWAKVDDEALAAADYDRTLHVCLVGGIYRPHTCNGRMICVGTQPFATGTGRDGCHLARCTYTPLVLRVAYHTGANGCSPF